MLEMKPRDPHAIYFSVIPDGKDLGFNHLNLVGQLYSQIGNVFI